jgi:hypothetical protein
VISVIAELLFFRYYFGEKNICIVNQKPDEMRAPLMKWGVLLVAVSLLALWGCTKEQMNANKLEGYWDVTLCEMGDEDMLEDVDMNFLFLPYSDGEGEVIWTWNTNEGLRGFGAIFTGEWLLNKDADEIEMDLVFTSDMKVEIVADIEISKEEIELDGTIKMSGSEKEDFVLEAKKRE